MKEFQFYNPVKIYFGVGAIENLKQELPGMGQKILLTYGGGSIQRNGIYDTIVRLLTDAGKKVYELPGIMANPRTTKVDGCTDLYGERNRFYPGRRRGQRDRLLQSNCHSGKASERI